MKRKRCCFCKKLTFRWQRINGSQWHCYDGCYSTTGYDRRTKDGKPLWEKEEQEAKTVIQLKFINGSKLNVVFGQKEHLVRAIK